MKITLELITKAYLKAVLDPVCLSMEEFLTNEDYCILGIYNNYGGLAAYRKSDIEHQLEIIEELEAIGEY